MEEQIKSLLEGIKHPETDKNLIEGGYVESIAVHDNQIVVVLQFSKVRDPFMQKLRVQTHAVLKEHYPDMVISVMVKEPEKRADKPQTSMTAGIKRVVAVASGKGGVGKSTVTANLATSLASLGYKVGILDADIYGPSQPKMFGCEGYVPDAYKEGDEELMIPATVEGGIRLMSIGFFIKPTDALLWRGAMAVNALKQLITQTKWDELDFLLLDLPPGTGDIHLSIINELKISGAVIVSTPQQVAIADVARSVEMFLNEQIAVPVLGIVENMAYFTPAELPQNRYYIFGRGGAKQYAEQKGLDVLGEIPIIQSIMESADEGRPASMQYAEVRDVYVDIARKVVDKLA